MPYQDDQREREYRSALKARVAEKRLIFTCTTGRSGTGYLARVLDCIPGVASSHEPEPRFSHHLREVQAYPERASEFWWDEKLPAIAAMREPVVVETSHLFCKGFVEPLLEAELPFDLIVLERQARLVATSLYQLNTVPARTESGLSFLLSPEDPGVLPLPGWQQMHDYQLCYWYCLETARRAELYTGIVRERGGRAVHTTLSHLSTREGFLVLVDGLDLPQPDRKGWRRYDKLGLRQVNTKDKEKRRARRPEIEDPAALEAEVEARSRVAGG